MKINANFVCFIVLFTFLLFVNIALPRQSDDFNHYYSALEGLKSAKYSYLNWNGRIGELLDVGFLARINPYIFDILNASVGVIFIFAFFVLVFARIPSNFKDIANIASLVFILMFSTAFGAVFAWETGSLNYLWGICLIVLFLLPFRFYLQDIFKKANLTNEKLCQNHSHSIINTFYSFPKYLKITLYLLFLVLSFMAGMASEIIGILSIIALISLNIFAFYRKRFCNDCVPFPMLLNIALLFFVLGYLMLYLSPGHAKRAVFESAYMSLSQILSLDLLSFIKRVGEAISSFKNSILLFFSLSLLFVLCVKKSSIKNIVIFAVASGVIVVLNDNLRNIGIEGFFVNLAIISIVLVILSKREIFDKKQSDYFYTALFLLFLAFCLCMASTIQFTKLPHRARFGDSMILIAMILLLFDRFSSKRFQTLTIIICVAYSIFVGFAFVEFRIKWDNMLSSISFQKAQGIRHIKIDDICHSKYKNLIDWGCPLSHPNAFPNTAYAKYFGVDSLISNMK